MHVEIYLNTFYFGYFLEQCVETWRFLTIFNRFSVNAFEKKRNI
jgi:hypothetical protein